MPDLQAVILAAGQGTRMKSRLPKVLHLVAGKAMVDHVVDAARTAGATSIVVVVGYEPEQLQRHFEGSDIELVQQVPQLGTGHALQQALPLLQHGEGDVVVLYGDAPLLRTEALRDLVAEHRGTSAQLSLLTATVPDPQRLARIIREPDRGRLLVREWADASPEELAITEVNPGVYCFDRAWLLAELPHLTLMPKGEYS